MLNTIDNIYSDLWHRLAGVRHIPEHVVLISLDDATLNTYRDDPLVFWTPHIAKASKALREAGVNTIGLDMMFTISLEQWLQRQKATVDPAIATYDVPIREEIASGQLIMVTSLLQTQEGFDDFLLPAPEHLLSIPNFDIASHVGIADLISDSDGGVRHFSMKPKLKLAKESDGNYLPSLTFAALISVHAINGATNAQKWDFGKISRSNNTDQHRISYTGPPGTIPRIPLYRLLEDNAINDPEIRALAGKTAIIGAEYAGINDVHITPYSTSTSGSGNRFMTGPELQANIVETLLSGRKQSSPSIAITTLYLVLVLLAFAIIFQQLGTPSGLIALLTGFAVTASISYTAFHYDLLINTAEIHTGLSMLFLGVLGLKHASEERERAKITHAFGRYVSDKVVDQIIQNGGHPVLGGITERVTVLFSDIRNFTTISERLDAQEVVEMLNTYFEQICQVVLDEGGTIDKFIGDAIMVQFGAPVHFDDHADRALRTALKMQTVANDFKLWMKTRFPNRDIPDFSIGIGIHTGDAVIGNIGSHTRLEYTAIGDTVNAASRIEGQTKELNCVILTSSTTIESAQHQIITGKSQTVSVKGKEEALELFEVLGMDS